MIRARALGHAGNGGSLVSAAREEARDHGDEGCAAREDLPGSLDRDAPDRDHGDRSRPLDRPAEGIEADDGVRVRLGRRREDRSVRDIRGGAHEGRRELFGGVGAHTDRDRRHEATRRRDRQIGLAKVQPRADERSDVELTQLDEDRTLISIERGDVALRLRSTEAVQETRLRTREGSIAAETTGLYRVEQLDRGTKAYAFQGRLRFDWQRANEAAPLWLAEGEQVEFWWPGGPRAERSRLYGDAFSDWVLAESRAEGDWQVARYVSPEMTGAEDLDRHGRWETAPEWGTVWIPSVVVPNWAPYRFGHWAWTRHWGWTWVDDAPWGFAPFHYGRWVIWGGRWCWVPGSYVHRPVYAPALVGWVGTGGVSVSITLGSRAAPPRVGWYPLAPREVYVPAYRHTPRYEYRVNDRPDWRAARDPIPPGRPHLYREQPAAVTVVPRPGQAHGFEPLPRGHDDGWRGAKSLPGAPSRGDFNAMLPPRPVAPRVPDSTPRDGGPR